MKKILTILLSLVAFGAFAQTLTYEELMRLEPKSHGKIEHYVASDGATYSIGDTIVIGQPSLNNDMFLTMQSALGIAATVLGGGWQTTSGASSANLNSYYIGKPIIINKIEYEVDKRGGEREVSVRGLVTGVGNVRCYMFEQALANGEIVSIGKQK